MPGAGKALVSMKAFCVVFGPLGRRLAATLAVLLLLPALLPARAFATEAEIEAEELTQTATLTLSTGQGTAVLQDRSRSSTLKLQSGGSLHIISDTPIAALYLIWDRPPEIYSVEGGSDVLSFGSGFLHQAILLEGMATDVTLALGPAGEDAEFVLCDVYLFGQGLLPGWVQQWQPTLEQADLLALPTHADDEHLFFGGILPTYAGQHGLKVQVAYLTHHWGERYRPHELLDGLWTVGVTAYPVIGPFPDLYATKESLAGAEAAFGRETVLEYQVELLRRFRPQVVVGHDLKGEYGHGAHILNAETLVEALALCGDEDAFPQSAQAYGAWQVPKCYLHLYAENQLVMDWNQPLERFGGATAFEMAEAGFARHVSQTEYFTVRQDGTWHDCRRFGLVHTLVGPDVAGDDLFENIDLTPEPEPEPEPESLPEPVASSAPAPESVPATPAASSTPPKTEPERNISLLPTLLILVAAALLLVVFLTLLRRRKR